MGENEEKKILIQNIVDCIGSMNNIDINRNILKNDLINGKKFKENEIENLLNEVFNGKETIQKQDALNKLSSLFQNEENPNEDNNNLVKPTNNFNLPTFDFKPKEHKNFDSKIKSNLNNENVDNEIRKVQSVKNELFSNKILDKINSFKNELLTQDNLESNKRSDNNFRERIEKLNRNEKNIKSNKNQIQKNDVNDIKGKINSLKQRNSFENKKDPFEDINNMLNNFKNKK
jgi:hypothetical protein